MGLNLKGGRGQKAPYEVTHVRTPKPLKALLESIIGNYRERLGDYEDPEDPSLIRDSLAAQMGSEAQEMEALKRQAQGMIQAWTETEQEVMRLRAQIEQLKKEQEENKIQKAIGDFIDYEKDLFGRNSAQKNKEFSMGTRRWDAFRYFIKFVALPKSIDGWNIGDRCAFTSPLTKQKSAGIIRAFKSDRLKAEILQDVDGATVYIAIKQLEKE